jgi:nuclear transport factor 2 (NTF2) superfamily protein
MPDPEVAVGQKWRERHGYCLICEVGAVGPDVIAIRHARRAQDDKPYQWRAVRRNRFLRAFELIEEKKP